VGDGDPRLAVFPEGHDPQPARPGRRFADLDAFFDSGEEQQHRLELDGVGADQRFHRA